MRPQGSQPLHWLLGHTLGCLDKVFLISTFFSPLGKYIFYQATSLFSLKYQILTLMYLFKAPKGKPEEIVQGASIANAKHKRVNQCCPPHQR